MPPPNNPLLAPREIIEILSDDESDDDLMEIAPPQHTGTFADVPTPAANTDFDAEWEAVMAVVEGEETAHEPIAEPHPMTEDECLSRVLEIYPDISHDHVRAMFCGGLDVGMLPDSTWCDQLIVRILDEGKYPTEREAKRAALKRKREPSDDDFERAPMDSGHFATRRAYQNAAVNTLQNHYREIPVAFIQQVLKEQGSFYKAFLRLEELDRTYPTIDPFRRPYRKVRIRDTRPLHSTASQESHVTEAMQTIAKESQAAKKKVGQEAVTRQHEEQKRLEEERNAAQARSLGEESECMSCFDTGPTNRMMFCDGANIHYLCQDCARNCVNAELDAGRCRPKCCDPTCGADFSNAQLKAFIDPKVFCRMEKLQQQDDLRKAGIENLVQCPFCDFQAECEPVEVDREFRCQNGDCETVSCRLCRLESHVPLTCEEAGKERSGNVRHHIEEAMTKALVRTCNGCKMPFMKSDGCNKMTCASCHHTQCYICSKSVTGYEHFHNSHGKCPLYDENVEKRHIDEVKAAEAKALEEVKKANPDLTDEELKIKLSDVVQKEEKRRLAAADRRQQQHGPFRVFAPGDPIAVPAAGGRRAQDAMVLDALVEPMMGMPPRLMGARIPEIPDFEAFNPAPNQRQVNNPQPQQVDVDAPRVNVRRLNIREAFHARNGNFFGFDALFPQNLFGNGHAVPHGPQLPNREGPWLGPGHRAQQPQNPERPGQGREHNFGGGAARLFGFGPRGERERQPEAQAQAQAQVQGPARVGPFAAQAHQELHNWPGILANPMDDATHRQIAQEHEVNLARLRQYEHMGRLPNHRQF